MDDLPERFWEQDGWLERMDQMGIDKDVFSIIDAEFDNEEFWQMCDHALIVGHSEHARRWLAMLEDPDPDDLIFEYQNIVRRIAYSMGYLRGLADRGTQT